ncbi:hypothetical protein [Brevibacillus sp. NL20B1]|jgi:hypothetical protein|uniref:hypothetical protein n=1 Tax=Brevibacillus sp. NL20B1 TaxID=2829799 RepID=UPI001BA19BB1|nr:hypothetical protein [Brevibacillus sp. NL20B1]MBR8660498.1 hypothetical protein [Brevibacillus sp. NL20B1]
MRQWQMKKKAKRYGTPKISKHIFREDNIFLYVVSTYTIRGSLEKRQPTGLKKLVHHFSHHRKT